jgi:hypothetical protein
MTHDKIGNTKLRPKKGKLWGKKVNQSRYKSGVAQRVPGS